jgi:hypothetical protein
VEKRSLMNVAVPAESVFRDRSEFASRIIRMSGMEECGRESGYVNLNLRGTTMAQIHPQRKQKGIALVLRSRRSDRPPTVFAQIEVGALEGYEGGSNRSWLDGRGQTFYIKKGPAIAFLIPDAVAQLGDDAPEWRDIRRLLAYARTLA